MNSPSAPGLRRWADAALLAVVVVTLAFFALTHEGLYALDDYYYARYAHQLLHGTFELGPDPEGRLHDPLHERWLIFGPVALCYALLGVNIISTTLWPLLATLGCSLLLWLSYRRREPLVAAGAVLLLGLHYFTLNLSTYLYPDNINMLACLAAALALNAGRRAAQPGRWGAGFALLNFAALLCKETVVYYVPFYLGLLLLDGYRRRHGRFWLSAALTGTALLAAYLLFYQVMTDDALYRIHLIEQTNNFLKEGNFLLGNRAALLARVTYGPLLVFIGSGLGLLLLLALGSGRPTAADAAADRYFWLGLGLSTLAAFWLGSTSLSQYNPITLQPRMMTPLLPPLGLAAAFGLRDVLLSGRRAGLYAAILVALAAFDRSSVAVLYLGWAGTFLALAGLARRSAEPGRWPRPGSTGYAGLGLLALGLVLLLRPAYFMGKPSASGHFAQDRVLRRQLPPAPVLLLVDDFLAGNVDFYFDFRVPADLRIRRYWARDSVQLAPNQPAYLLLNRATLSNPELTRKLLRYSADSVLRWYPRRELLARDGPVELYRVQLHGADSASTNSLAQ
ncbi:glycosyltransferase family 39 protein [Hymenobacter sp. B81]|uniref:glycosyltransferase family 39 protein n=1 Tax=Hymenobacter sp. B81 TaxID=3344878 RepID=UPI0037DD6253